MKFIKLQADSAYELAVQSLASAEKIVVCGSEEDKSYIEESMEASEQSASEIIAAAESIDIQEWFSNKRKALETDFSDSLGNWLGESEAKQGLTLAFDMMTGQPHQDLVGAQIATDESWQIPAFFKYGGWNECPDPALHCAIWKYWQEKYGAHIVGVSNDVIEAYVTKPPATQQAAIELAIEQYLYCADIVDQGVETISNLGSAIINHHAWYFWWD